MNLECGQDKEAEFKFIYSNEVLIGITVCANTFRNADDCGTNNIRNEGN